MQGSDFRTLVDGLLGESQSRKGGHDFDFLEQYGALNESCTIGHGSFEFETFNHRKPNSESC